MKHKSILYLLCISVVFQYCKPSGPGISGTISNAANMTVYFDRVDPFENVNSIIARGDSDNNGKFSIPLEQTPEAGPYRVRVGAKSAYFVLDGTEQQLSISGDINTLGNFDYQIDGSAVAQNYLNQMSGMVTGTKTIDDIKSYILTQANPQEAIFMTLQMFASPEFADFVNQVNAKAKAQNVKNSQFDGFARSLMAEKLKREALEKIKVGEVAPDIAMPDVNGKIRQLSELKGKIVLLDFWASWCGPCRRENPHVVQVYDKYKHEGFTVFSVSLDGLEDRRTRNMSESQKTDQIKAHKRRWLAAIEKDNLKWDTHVSDLKKWDSSAAALYGVRSIPRTFLIDRDGRIAYVNPRRNLEQAIQSLL